LLDVVEFEEDPEDEAAGLDEESAELESEEDEPASPLEPLSWLAPPRLDPRA